MERIPRKTFGSKGEEGIEEERRSEGTDDNEDMITI
jgi:hypothetical protein